MFTAASLIQAVDLPDCLDEAPDTAASIIEALRLGLRPLPGDRLDQPHAQARGGESVALLDIALQYAQELPEDILVDAAATAARLSRAALLWQAHLTQTLAHRRMDTAARPSSTTSAPTWSTSASAPTKRNPLSRQHHRSRSRPTTTNPVTWPAAPRSPNAPSPPAPPKPSSPATSPSSTSPPTTPTDTRTPPAIRLWSPPSAAAGSPCPTATPSPPRSPH